MLADAEIVLPGDLVLQLFDFRAENSVATAAASHHMVVVRAFVQLATPPCWIKVMAHQNASLLKLGDAVDRQLISTISASR